MKGPLYSYLSITHLPSGSRTLNWHLETIYMQRDALPTTPSYIPVSNLIQCPAPNTPTHLCVCRPGEISVCSFPWILSSSASWNALPSTPFPPCSTLAHLRVPRLLYHLTSLYHAKCNAPPPTRPPVFAFVNRVNGCNPTVSRWHASSNLKPGFPLRVSIRIRR